MNLHSAICSRAEATSKSLPFMGIVPAGARTHTIARCPFCPRPLRDKSDDHRRREGAAAARAPPHAHSVADAPPAAAPQPPAAQPPGPHALSQSRWRQLFADSDEDEPVVHVSAAQSGPRACGRLRALLYSSDNDEEEQRDAARGEAATKCRSRRSVIADAPGAGAPRPFF